jgi:transcriptional regulator with XRE-family HTH domain
MNRLFVIFDDMKINELTSDAAILEEIGKRLLQARIDSNLTQAELAEQAGVSKRTVERIEAGMSSQLSNLIRILRVLDLLSALDSALPQAGPRPMDLLKLGGKQRQRVVKRGGGEQAETWEWGDEE